LHEPHTGWLSYFQLIQEVIDGAKRRNTFSPWELELMLDLEVSRLRKSSRPAVLRRYLRFVQTESMQAPRPTRFSAFTEREIVNRQDAKAANSG
jgi:hypothetical protein